MFALPRVSGRLPCDALVDIDGRELGLRELCREHLVIVCTLKVYGCPVCPEQVRRLMGDPLRGIFEAAGVRFLILCPGTDEMLAEIRGELEPCLRGSTVYWVCDKDHRIARAINADMGPSMIIPCFFEIRSDLRVGWTQVGRGLGHFGDGKVRAFVEDRRDRAREELGATRASVAGLLAEVRGSPARRPPAPCQEAVLSQDTIKAVLPYLDLPAGARASESCREWHMAGVDVAAEQAGRFLGETAKCAPGSEYCIPRLEAARAAGEVHRSALGAAVHALSSRTREKTPAGAAGGRQGGAAAAGPSVRKLAAPAILYTLLMPVAAALIAQLWR